MTRPKLSPERHAEVVRNVALGQPHRVAANLAGLGERTLERYLQRGREADEAARAALRDLPATQSAWWEALSDEPAPPPDPRHQDRYPPDALRVNPTTNTLEWTPTAEAQGHADSVYARLLVGLMPEAERRYWRLWRSVKRADAASEAVLLARIAEDGRGVDATETKVVEVVKDGNVVQRTTTTVTRRTRHWQANAFLLQNRFPEHYPRYRGGGVLGVPVEDEPDSETEGIDDEKAAAFAGIDELEERRQRQDREAAEAREAADG